MSRPRFWFLTALAVFAAASRVLPHPMNFTPTVALALFGAATFPSFRSSLLVTFGALLASDTLLQLTYLAGWQPSWGFYPNQWVVYACVLATMMIGLLARRRRDLATIGAATLASSVLFFLVTNFAVWATVSEAVYPRTWSGLLVCYTEALPFFRNGLAGDLFFSTVLFGGLALAEARFPALRSAKAGAVVA